MGGGKTPFSERLEGMFREAEKEEKRIPFLCLWGDTVREVHCAEEVL
jgi:hypothetical protein